jgi:hypothetical protein
MAVAPCVVFLCSSSMSRLRILLALEEAFDNCLLVKSSHARERLFGASKT